MAAAQGGRDARHVRLSQAGSRGRPLRTASAGIACAFLLSAACVFGCAPSAAAPSVGASSAAESSSSAAAEAAAGEAAESGAHGRKAGESISGEEAGDVGASDGGAVDAAYVESLEDAAYLVDVRTPEEYAEGHIPGALNASYPKSTGGPCQAGENASSFRLAWGKLGVPADAHVVLYCRTGVRAASAQSALREDGYDNVEVYAGGWVDWISDSSRPIG